MTQKTIGNLLKRLRKKRNEAVLAVGKIDREIDEAIARAKSPNLKLGIYLLATQNL